MPVFIKQLIATTCSSITHSVFNQYLFDYCIVDEASQVLQTTCIGPLLCSQKFVLVGDSQQLPPIIKNKEARFSILGSLGLRLNFLTFAFTEIQARMAWVWACLSILIVKKAQSSSYISTAWIGTYILAALTVLMSNLHVCSDIMNLANEITYDAKLKCISDKVAKQTLLINENFLSKVRLVVYYNLVNFGQLKLGFSWMVMSETFLKSP